jgi:hypothetical protein
VVADLQTQRPRFSLSKVPSRPRNAPTIHFVPFWNSDGRQSVIIGLRPFRDVQVVASTVGPRFTPRVSPAVRFDARGKHL